MALPLDGISVVEFGQNLAGPFCAEILAHMGADVVKVERPGTGDDARGWGPPFGHGTSAAFHSMNVNKRSIAVDLKDAAAVARLRGLVGRSDVLVQNMRPGVDGRAGPRRGRAARRVPRGSSTARSGPSDAPARGACSRATSRWCRRSRA